MELRCIILSFHMNWSQKLRYNTWYWLDLSYSTHISNCIPRIYSSLRILFSNWLFMVTSLKLQLFNLSVLSHFDYCDTVYGAILSKVGTLRVQQGSSFGIRKFNPSLSQCCTILLQKKIDQSTGAKVQRIEYHHHATRLLSFVYKL